MSDKLSREVVAICWLTMHGLSSEEVVARVECSPQRVNYWRRQLRAVQNQKRAEEDCPLYDSTRKCCENCLNRGMDEPCPVE